MKIAKKFWKIVLYLITLAIVICIGYWLGDNEMGSYFSDMDIAIVHMTKKELIFTILITSIVGSYLGSD